MTSVATFELKTIVDLSTLKTVVSSYWQGDGYKVDIQSWKPDTLNRTLCILEYFYSGDIHELEMMTMTAKYLLSVAQDDFLYYYRCIDFLGDLDSNHENYFGGKFMGNLNIEKLTLPEYQPSMASSEIYIITD